MAKFLQRRVRVGVLVGAIAVACSFPINAAAWQTFEVGHGTLSPDGAQHHYSNGGLTRWNCGGTQTPSGGGDCPGQPQYGIYDDMYVTYSKTGGIQQFCAPVGPFPACPLPHYKLVLGGSSSVFVYQVQQYKIPSITVNPSETIVVSGSISDYSFSFPPAISVNSPKDNVKTFKQAPDAETGQNSIVDGWGGAGAVTLEGNDQPISAQTRTESMVTFDATGYSETSAAINDISFASQ